MTEETSAILNPQQARVFACLVEKHLSTPKSYPLTIHSLILACNQKSHRHPVMHLEEGQVEHLAKELVELNLARIEYGSRANKVMHRAMGELKINREQAAVLCMLILREPLTLNDIKSRTEKMVAFDNSEAVQAAVDELLNREEPLILLVPKSSGKREDRYTHTLCGELAIENIPDQAASKNKSEDDLKGNDKNLLQRIVELEERLDKVEHILDDLIN